MNFIVKRHSEDMLIFTAVHYLKKKEKDQILYVTTCIKNSKITSIQNQLPFVI